MNELKKYFYENLYILNDAKINNYESIEKIEKEIDLKAVCMNCDQTIPCKLMSGYSNSEDLMRLWNKVLTIDQLNIFKYRERETPRVMFIFENPGQNWFGDTSRNDKIKKIVSYDSLNYWFSKKNDLENKDISSFPYKKESLYAFAISHLIYKYGIKNIHVTNSVKCKPAVGDNMNNSPDNNLNCMVKFLKVEIEHFKPDVIFCFGNNAFNNLNLLIIKDPSIKSLLFTKTVSKLLHPAMRGRAVKYHKKRLNASNLFEVLRNDWYQNIEKALE